MGKYHPENYSEIVKLGDVELPCQCWVLVLEKGKVIVSHNGIHEQTGWKTAKVAIRGQLEGKDEDDLQKQIKMIIALGKEQEALSIISKETDTHNISKIVLEDDPKITLIEGFELSRNLVIEGIEDEEVEFSFDLVKKRREDIKRITEPKKKEEKGVYVVKAGDSLSEIAKREYGNLWLWRVLNAANEGVVGANYLIRPGDKLVIPKLPTTEQEYTVKKGELYSTISKAFFFDVVYKSIIQKTNEFKTLIAGEIIIIPPLQGYEEKVFVEKYKRKQKRKR